MILKAKKISIPRKTTAPGFVSPYLDAVIGKNCQGILKILGWIIFNTLLNGLEK